MPKHPDRLKIRRANTEFATPKPVRTRSDNILSKMQALYDREQMIPTAAGPMKDDYAPEWRTRKDRAEVMSDYVKQFGDPDIGEIEGKFYTPDRAYYRRSQNKMFVDPSQWGSSWSRKGPTGEEYDDEYVVTEMDDQILAEAAHARQNKEQTKAWDIHRLGWDKFGTGGNARALLETAMVGLGQGIIGKGRLKNLLGDFDRGDKDKIKNKIGEKIFQGGRWLAGYTRPGSLEYEAHQDFQPQMQDEFVRRLIKRPRPAGVSAEKRNKILETLASY